MQLVFIFTVHIWWLSNTRIWRNSTGLSLYNPLFIVTLTSFHIPSWSAERTGLLESMLKERYAIFNGIQETQNPIFTQIVPLLF